MDACHLIYLNTVTDSDVLEPYWQLYEDILSRYRVVTNVLVFDETIYISKKKYGVSNNVTLDFVETEILPYVDIIPMGLEEYEIADEIIRNHGLKPSDALHIGTMLSSDISTIISEDGNFDCVDGLDRIWI